MRRPIKREKLDDPIDDGDRDRIEGKAEETRRRVDGRNGGTLLVRNGGGRPAGQPNAVTQQVALGLKRGQSLTTGQVKRGLLEVVAFLGFTQKPTEAEIKEFLGPGNGGHRGFLLQTALTRRRTFERWYERALIPQQIKAELDADSLMARCLQAASAMRSAREGNSGADNGRPLIDVTPRPRRSFADAEEER
jgi:hypothetical protein